MEDGACPPSLCGLGDKNRVPGNLGGQGSELSQDVPRGVISGMVFPSLMVHPLGIHGILGALHLSSGVPLPLWFPWKLN